MTVEVQQQAEAVETQQMKDVMSEKVDEVKASIVEKSSSYREESNFVSDLKESERKALNDLKSKLEEAISANKLFKKENDAEKTEEDAEKSEENSPDVEIDTNVSIWGIPLDGHKGTDVVLLKFLRARDFKINEAFEMLKKTLQWRKDENVDSVLEEEDLGADLGSVSYMNGVDREGRPICYNIFGALGDEELYKKTFGTEEKRKQFLRWRVQLMEKGIQKLDFKAGGINSLIQINDLSYSPGPSRKELRVATKQAVSLLQDNYPEFAAKNIFINVPYWYYALNSLLSPFLTQRTKSKFVIAHPAKVTETLLKYVSIQEIPTQYGGLKRGEDFEFSSTEDEVLEIMVKAGATQVVEIPTPEVETTFIWDVTVLGWEVNYKEEFVPADENSYTIIVQKEKKMASNSEPIRKTFKNTEPGKIVLTITNSSSKKKKAFCRYKIKKCST